MSVRPSVLPDELVRAIEGCLAALDARPWDHPSLELQTAVLDALGPKGSARRLRLAQLSAQSVVPMWMHAHPEDERALRLLDDLEDAMRGEAREVALRDALERETYVTDPALSALRAILLAHDHVRGDESRAEPIGLPDLCAFAWLDAEPELVPDARSPEPLARSEAWFRWWLAEAVPTAWRSSPGEPARVLAPEGADGSARSTRTEATGAGEPIYRPPLTR